MFCQLLPKQIYKFGISFWSTIHSKRSWTHNQSNMMNTLIINKSMRPLQVYAILTGRILQRNVRPCKDCTAVCRESYMEENVSKIVIWHTMLYYEQNISGSSYFQIFLCAFSFPAQAKFKLTYECYDTSYHTFRRHCCTRPRKSHRHFK